MSEDDLDNLYEQVMDESDHELNDPENFTQWLEGTDSFEQIVEGIKARDKRLTAALQRRVEELEEMSAQVYQVVGSLASDADLFGNTATTKVLDNLSMAASGKPLPHAELLPFPAKTPHEARG